jgi:hypothetical protein
MLDRFEFDQWDIHIGSIYASLVESHGLVPNGHLETYVDKCVPNFRIGAKRRGR